MIEASRYRRLRKKRILRRPNAIRIQMAETTCPSYGAGASCKAVSVRDGNGNGEGDYDRECECECRCNVTRGSSRRTQSDRVIGSVGRLRWRGGAVM
jgi:hypothetical protein